MMKLQYLISALAFVLVNTASALPNLASPSDIDVVSHKNSVIEITNTADNSILECELIRDKLQDCKSIKVDGLVSPYRLASVQGSSGTSKVFVTQKDTVNIFSYGLDGEGKVSPDTKVVEVPSLLGEHQKILEFRLKKSQSTTHNILYLQRFYLSLAKANKNGRYGQFGALFIDPNDINKSQSETYKNTNLPIFSLEPDEKENSEKIIGVGHVGGGLSDTDMVYPFSGVIRGKYAQLDEKLNRGGSVDSVKSPLSPGVNSIAHFDDKYWVTYKSAKKFTRFDAFPTQSAVAPSTYQAPTNANVRLKTVSFTTPEVEVHKNFALFSDDNKVGICRGDSDFTCSDAFRYLDVVLSANGTNDIPLMSYTAHGLSDYGHITFRNVNYSPLTSEEVTSEFPIPDDVKEAFSGSCLNKIDFASKESENDAGNDTCTLNFDFRKLSNLPEISESFDVGFKVNGAFGAVPTTFHFNIDLPSSTPHLEFQKDGQTLTELNLHAGDTGSFDIIYLGNDDQTLDPKSKLSFLYGKDKSTTFRSYFADTGCLSTNASELSAGDTCTLSLRVPADANNQVFTLQLDNPDTIPSEDNTLTVNVASSGNIIAHSPYDNQSLDTLSPIHTIDIQPNTETLVRFTNVGAADAHNFSVHFIQTKEHIPLVLSGSCTESSDLQALGGYCDLRIKLDKSDTRYGRYYLQVTGDDITHYSIPISIGGFPIDQGLAVVDLQTGLVGAVNIYKGTKGTLKVRNFMGYPIKALIVLLPKLYNTSVSGEPLISIFQPATDSKVISCLQSAHSGVLYKKLEPLSGCEFVYNVAYGVNVRPQDVYVNFEYDNPDQTKSFSQFQAIHFTNQDAVSVSFAHTDQPLDKVSIDASVPQTTLIFKNNLDRSIAGFNVSGSTGQVAISQNTCQSKTLPPEQVCSVTITLDDESPNLGNYQLKTSGDIVNERDIPLAIEQAQTDTVEVDNRGGYSMSVDYINYHPNSDGTDSQCQSGACYGKTSTGWFTNPFNTQITGVSGRQLNMYMMAGTSVSLPSCDGGKVVCTGTTLSPSCVYVGDGTDKATPQNQCLKYNQ